MHELKYSRLAIAAASALALCAMGKATGDAQTLEGGGAPPPSDPGLEPGAVILGTMEDALRHAGNPVPTDPVLHAAVTLNAAADSVSSVAVQLGELLGDLNKAVTAARAGKPTAAVKAAVEVIEDLSGLGIGEAFKAMIAEGRKLTDRLQKAAPGHRDNHRVNALLHELEALAGSHPAAKD